MRRLLAAAGFLLLALSACSGAPERPDKAAAPLVWCRPAELAALQPADLDRLRDAGARELFVEAAALSWGAGGTPELEVTTPSAPRRQAATLVVTGDWPAATGLAEEPEEAARALAARLGALALAAEGGGLLPVGFHFAPRLADPPAEGEDPALAGFAAVLAALRDEVDGSLFLSAGLDRRRLGEPEAAALASAVDFLVVPLYGQGPDDLLRGDAPAAWDLDAAEEGARAADALGRPFFAGAVTLGTALVLDAGARPLAATSAASFGRLVADPALAIGRAGVLAGGARQLLLFEAERATRVGDREVAAGQKVRTIRPSAGNLLELARRLGGLDLPNYRGLVYRRLPGPDERLSLPLGALAAVLRGEEPDPGLGLALTVLGADVGGRRTVVRVTLANRGELPTGVALFSSNYVELKVTGGAFGAVDRGRFYRYTLERDGHEAASMQDVLHADTVKLYLRVLEAGATVASGPIEVGAEGDAVPRVVAGGRFLLAGGDLYDLPPASATSSADAGGPG